MQSLTRRISTICATCSMSTTSHSSDLLLKDESSISLMKKARSGRGMMVVGGLHDRIGTRPASVRMFDHVFDHMRRKKDKSGSPARSERSHVGR